jgi:hypothetical protein
MTGSARWVGTRELHAVHQYTSGPLAVAGVHQGAAGHLWKPDFCITGWTSCTHSEWSAPSGAALRGQQLHKCTQYAAHFLVTWLQNLSNLVNALLVRDAAARPDLAKVSRGVESEHPLYTYVV